MADEAARSRLGRGLAALIGDVGVESQTPERARNQRRVPIEFLRANPRNPRRLFSDAELDELTASIRERGIIQPIVVRNRGADVFEIIAGERRWRAAQRADLNAVEEAMGYSALIEEFNHSQEDVAQIVGKSRSHVANTLRLLKLSEPVKAYIRAGKLTAGHARTLIGQPNAEELARDIVERGLNVRQVEAIARQSGKTQAKEAKGHFVGKDSDTRALEKRLSDVLGLIVSVDHRGQGGGVLRIRYKNLEQLDDVLRRLDRK